MRFLLPLFSALLLTLFSGCASFFINKDPDAHVFLRGEIKDEHQVEKNDNFLTVLPMAPLFGVMNFGRTTGFLGTTAGLSATNTRLKTGSLNVEGLYHFSFNADGNKTMYEYEYPAGKIPKFTLHAHYDLPVLRLPSSEHVRPIVLATFTEEGVSKYLYMDRDVRFAKQFNLRVGANSDYIEYSFSNSFVKSISHPDDTKVMQRAHSISGGLSFTRTVNTSFTALIEDERFKPIYKPRLASTDEFYFVVNFYAGGNVLPILTGDSMTPNYEWIVSEKRPEEFLMKLRKTGFETGYYRTMFTGRFLALKFGAAIGTGTGYLPLDAGPFYFKARMLVGFGAIKKGN